MGVYVLKLKSGTTSRGAYFGGADFEDMWFARTTKSAYQYTNRREAEVDSRRFGGIDGIREFKVVKISS